MHRLEVTIDKQNQQLVECNKAVTTTKHVLHVEVESTSVSKPCLPCSPPKSDIVVDERHVIMVDEARTMPSLDSCVIEISSSNDNSSPSSSALIKAVCVEENRQYALKVLHETFPNIKPPSPPNPVSSSAGLDSHPNSHSPLSTTTTAEDRNDNAVAPLPPVTKLLHPTKKHTHPSISGRVVELLNNLCPRPGSISGYNSNVGSFGFAGDQQDMVDSDDQDIPSAQPRPPHAPVPLPPTN